MQLFLGLLSCLGKIRVTLSRKNEATTSHRVIYIIHQSVPVPTRGVGIFIDPTNALEISFTIQSLHEFIFLAISIFSVKQDYSNSN